MRIGTRLSAVAVACSLVALALYGVWSVTIRRDQLLREVALEEQNLAVILRSALEFALEHRDLAQAREVVETFSTAERVFGIAVHGLPGESVVRSQSLAPYETYIDPQLLAEVRTSGVDRQLRFDADGRRLLVHLLPLWPEGAQRGVAEVWRDLSYIDVYLRQTALRLLVLAGLIGAVLSLVIVFITRRSVTQPAAALVGAMEQVAAGNLGIRVAAAGPGPEGELGEIARAFDRLASSLQQAQSDLAQASQDRAALASRLRQSERLATLGQVVAEVAHEIGTPLNVVTGRAEYLEAVVEQEPKATQAARTIAEQGRRIKGILQRLLEVARERMPVLVDVEVREVVRRTSDFLTPELAGAGVTLDADVSAAVIARADPDLLQQVTVNLVMNAVHASPRGGRVRVSAEDRDGRVRLRVTDEGPGVAADILPRLFTPFATTKPSGKGTGLGLSISRSILRQLGGELRYVERPGERGACFEAELLSAQPGRSSGPEAA